MHTLWGDVQHTYVINALKQIYYHENDKIIINACFAKCSAGIGLFSKRR